MPLFQPSAEPAPIPLISAFLPQIIKPTLQPSATNTPPLPQLSDLLLQLYVPPRHPSAVHAAPPPQLSVLLQGRGKTPILSSTVIDYVTLLSALLIRKGVTIIQPPYEPAPLPELSA